MRLAGRSRRTQCSRPGQEGFDGMAILVVDCDNQGTPMRLQTAAPAPESFGPVPLRLDDPRPQPPGARLRRLRSRVHNLAHSSSLTDQLWRGCCGEQID
jgi:hypothetical protein